MDRKKLFKTVGNSVGKRFTTHWAQTGEGTEKIESEECRELTGEQEEMKTDGSIGGDGGEKSTVYGKPLRAIWSFILEWEVEREPMKTRGWG